MRLCKLIVIVSALVLTFPVFSKLPAGQSPQNPPKSAVPTLKVYARETIVDVIVTDSKGEPIRGLKQSDFLIKEDGKPQPVRSFKEYGFEPPLPGGLIRKPPPPNIHSNVDVVPTSGPVNIILIDALHLDIVSTVRSLQAIAQYFKRMPQGTEVAIFWLSSSGLHLLQGFTSDPTLLLAAAQTNRTDIGSNEDCYEQDWATADALNQIAVYVAGIQGRKNLVWFTPGMPLNLMRDGGYSWGAASSCRDATPRAFGGNFGDSGGLVNVSCGTLDRFGGQCNSGPTLFTGSEDGIDMGMVHRLMDLYELFSEEQIAISPVSSLGVGGLGTAQLVAEQVAEIEERVFDLDLDCVRTRNLKDDIMSGHEREASFDSGVGMDKIFERDDVREPAGLRISMERKDTTMPIPPSPVRVNDSEENRNTVKMDDIVRTLPTAKKKRKEKTNFKLVFLIPFD